MQIPKELEPLVRDVKQQCEAACSAYASGQRDALQIFMQRLALLKVTAPEQEDANGTAAS